MKIGNTIIDGYLDIGLYDTIEDMICAVVGSILFIIIYKVNLFYHFKQDLVSTKNDRIIFV